MRTSHFADCVDKKFSFILLSEKVIQQLYVWNASMIDMLSYNSWSLTRDIIRNHLEDFSLTTKKNTIVFYITVQADILAKCAETLFQF